MSKKSTSLLVLVLLAFTAIGQTIVSTSPENQKVILEEFTGIHCVFCPDGHAIAQAIKDANPDDVFLINIHTGSYANPGTGEPDFRTPYGSAIAGQSGLIGYPAGTVNRLNFPGFEQGASGTTAMSRNRWAAASNQTMGEGSNVNVAVEATLDVSTNELIVHVEAYYTGNSPEATNLLNVALLQNNTLGPQTGGNSGDDYNHQHRLVEMITGQWGITIPVTTTGTFVDETFTYPVPTDYNGVPVELADLEIVAFISETHQSIPSGSGTIPVYTGLVNQNDANVRYIDELSTACVSAASPSVNIQNLGQDTITSLDITYSINSGTPSTYTWTGNLTSLQNETITLPEISFTMQSVNTVEVTVPNDDVNTNNEASLDFDQAIDATTTVNLVLNTDNYGSEVRWNVKDYEGTTLYNGGPYGNNQTINETFNLPGNCYTFNLIDTYGDGGGAVTLTDSNNTVIYETNGVYGSGASTNFSTDGVVILGLESNELEATVIYPNPATTELNILNAENSSIEVYNMLGQILYAKNNISINEKIIVSQLTAGTYFVKITNGNAIKTSKFLKN